LSPSWVLAATPPVPDVSKIPVAGDDDAKRTQEQIQKSQERVLDLIKKMVSYIKEAATDTENTKLSQELETQFTNSSQKTYENMILERTSLDTYLKDVCKYEKVSLSMPQPQPQPQTLPTPLNK
jgi:hypothetical protein